MEQPRPTSPSDPAPPSGKVPLDFSLRARTAYEAAEEAFEQALNDPESERVVVPADGWEALIGLAASYAIIPPDGRASPTIDALADRARQVFHDALTNIATHAPAEIHEACQDGFTIATEAAA